MFLWAHLVLQMLENAGNINELQLAVKGFPKDLAKLYNSILAKIVEAADTDTTKKVVRILGWIAFSKRPLKANELQYGLILHHGNTRICRETKPLVIMYNICKPFIEDGPNDTVVFAHSSVKE